MLRLQFFGLISYKEGYSKKLHPAMQSRRSLSQNTGEIDFEATCTCRGKIRGEKKGLICVVIGEKEKREKIGRSKAEQ